LALALLGPARGQEPPRAQPEAPASAPAPAPASPQAPAGPFGSVGRFIDESLQGLGQGIKGARDHIDDLTGRAGSAAKEAADPITRLRRPSVVAGHERCLPAPNGAPDCVTATALMCRANGFESGSSIDMQTEQKCPAPAPGSASPAVDESQCWLESYVLRALCR